MKRVLRIAPAALLWLAAGVLATPTTAAAQGGVEVGPSAGAVSQGFRFVVQGPLTQNRAGELVSRGYPVVETVTEGSSAERAGLRVGDVLVEVNGRDARRAPAVPKLKHGDELTLRIRRGEREREIRFRVE